MEGSMKIQSAMNSCLLIAAIALSSFSDVQRFKAPSDVQLQQGYVCTGDYIWLYIPGPEIKSDKYRIVRMHVPSRVSQVFDFNDFGINAMRYHPRNLVATDSNHCAFLTIDGDVAYYDGTIWKNIKGKRIENLAATRSGSLIMNSQDYFGSIENDVVKFTLRDSTGLTDMLMAVASDSMENIYLASKHKVAKYDGTAWTIIFSNDTVNLEWVHILPDNSVYVQVTGTNGPNNSRRLTGDGPEMYTFSQIDSINSSVFQFAKDASGNKWHNIRESRCEFHMEMINGTDTVNGTNAFSRGWKNWPEFLHGGVLGFRASDKHVYIALTNGFYHYDGGPDSVWKWIPLAQTFNALDTIGANVFFPSSDSSIYIYHGYGRNLIKYKNNEFSTFPNLAGGTIFVDHQGVLWTQIDGYLSRFEDPFFKKFLFLPYAVEQITEDNQGRIMVLCSQGSSLEQQIFRKSNSDWEIFNQTNSNMPVKSIAKIVQSSNGTYWLSSFEDGVAKSSDLHTWTYYDSSNSTLPHRYIYDIFADKNGNVFVAVGADVYGTSMIYKYTGNQWDTLGVTSAENGGKLNVDSYGKLWFGMNYYDGEEWHTVDTTMVLNDFKIDSSNRLWCATYDKIFLTTNDEFYSFSPQASFVRSITRRTEKRTVAIRTVAGFTTIDYVVEKPSNVTLSIFSLQGKLVAVLKKGYVNSGSYSTVWKNNGAKGMYIVRYASPAFVYSIPLKIF
jgi:hypothetical protein